MLTRQIPKSGEPLPVIGLGTWQTFNVGRSTQEVSPLTDVFRRFIEAGSRVIDTSPMYGRAESVIGELRAQRESTVGEVPELFLSTKVWTSGRERGEEQMETSLERLGVERIDLISVHNLVDWKVHLETLRRWKDEGRIRYLGITHYQVSAFKDLEKIIRTEEIDFVQLPYSPVQRDAEKKLLPLAAEREVAVLANRPLDEGAALKKLQRKELPEWAVEIDCSSWAEIFLKFIVSHPAVTCAIPATSNPEHMTTNMRAGEGRMPDESLRKKIAAVIGEA